MYISGVFRLANQTEILNLPWIFSFDVWEHFTFAGLVSMRVSKRCITTESSVHFVKVLGFRYTNGGIKELKKKNSWKLPRKSATLPQKCYIRIGSIFKLCCENVHGESPSILSVCARTSENRHQFVSLSWCWAGFAVHCSVNWNESIFVWTSFTLQTGSIILEPVSSSCSQKNFNWAD